ncbi:MAG: hypothetical protein ACYCZB_18185 [Acidiphilium sp.]
MTVDARSGEREETPEEDAARQAQSEAKFIGCTVERLLQTRAMEFPASAEFLRRLDVEINVLHRIPSRADVARVKELAWKWRREMPRPIAPMLPPHDPVAKEMGLV